MRNTTRRGRITSFLAPLAMAASLSLASVVGPVGAMAESDLAELSLEDLMNTEVTSVSKKAQSKNDAAAAITVITNEDLRRGGFTSVPDALQPEPPVLKLMGELIVPAEGPTGVLGAAIPAIIGV